MTSSQRSARHGKQAPRVLLRPKFDSEDDAHDAIGLVAACGQDLDPFQVTLVLITLASLGGKLAASEVGALIARQNGKGGWLEAVAIFSLFETYLYGEERLPGRKNTTLWTAHELKTSDEAYGRVKSLIEANEDLAAEVVTWNGGLTGTHIIELRDGSRLIFLARSKSSGRGFSPRRIIFDEAQELGALAFRAMMFATSAQKNRQLIFAGTVPSEENDSGTFTGVRDRGRSTPPDKPKRLAWAEWSPKGSDDRRTPPDPTDPVARAEANPALGIRIAFETLDEEYEASIADPDGFMRERMSVWPSDDAAGAYLFPKWGDLAKARPETVAALGVSCDLKRKGLYLGGSDGKAVGLITPAAFQGSGAWVPMAKLDLFVSEVARISTETGAPVLLQKDGPAWHIADALTNAGARVVPVPLEDFIQAGADIENRVDTLDLAHADDADLNADLRKAKWKDMAGKRLVLAGDVPALDSVVLALHGAATAHDPLDNIW